MFYNILVNQRVTKKFQKRLDEIAENNHVTVKGPKGTLERTLPSEMDIKVEGSEVVVTIANDLKKRKCLHG